MKSFAWFPFTTFSIVSGWSEEGHQIITNAAVRLISEQAIRYLENHLGDDLLGASVWADSEEASTRYPNSSEYHFSHTPYRDCQPFDINRDCGFPGKEGLCIVTGLADAIEQATDPNVAKDDKVDALKFVLHLMGDIHQPLHTGFRKDFGGNAISISNMQNKTLHGLWDFDLVRRRIGTSSIDAFTDLIVSSVQSKSGAFIKRLQDQTDVLSVIANGSTEAIVRYTASIATDTTISSTCKLAYMKNSTNYIEDGDVITDEYLDQRGLSVQIQLSKAAVRLSILLDAMAYVYASRRAEQKEVAREERIKKLFSEREKAAAILAKKVPNPLEGNRYAVLAMEFDPIKLQWVMPLDEAVEKPGHDLGENIISRTPTAPRGIGKQDTEEDERVLLDQIIAERKRTTFQGVDLSQIVLLLRHGLNIVTTIRNANTRGYTPQGISGFRVKFSGNAHGHETIPFHFDYDVFPKNLTIELAVRCILRIRGIDVDGTTDLSTLWTDRGYGESVKSVERDSRLFPKAAEMQYMAGGVTGYGSFGKNASEERVRYGQQLALRTNAYLKHQSEKRFDQLDREFHAYKEKQGRRKTVSIEDFWLDRIKKVKSDILFFNQGRVRMATLASTLSNPSNALRIRFNKFDVFPTDADGEKGEHISLLVDPNICDSYLSPMLYRELSKVSNKDSKKRLILIHRPTFYDELSDLESVIFGTDETRLEKLKSIQYIRMHNTKGNKAWNQPMFRVVEWATKSAPPTIFDPPDDFVLPPS